MFCPHCGQKISNPRAGFCPYCGYQISSRFHSRMKSQDQRGVLSTRPSLQNTQFQSFVNRLPGHLSQNAVIGIIIVVVVVILFIGIGIHHETTHYTNSTSFAPTLVGSTLHGDDMTWHLHKTTINVSDSEGDSKTYHVDHISPYDDNNRLHITTDEGQDFLIKITGDHVYILPEDTDNGDY